jgi:hypothetical protein
MLGGDVKMMGGTKVLMIPEPSQKTVKIPAKVVGGRLQFLYGGPMPPLVDGTVLDIVVSQYSLRDPTWVKILQHECPFRAKPNTDSRANRTRIPTETEH